MSTKVLSIEQCLKQIWSWKYLHFRDFFFAPSFLRVVGRKIGRVFFMASGKNEDGPVVIFPPVRQSQSCWKIPAKRKIDPWKRKKIWSKDTKAQSSVFPTAMKNNGSKVCVSTPKTMALIFEAEMFRLSLEQANTTNGRDRCLQQKPRGPHTNTVEKREVTYIKDKP